MHVLVVGGAGFIGSHTVDLLRENSHQVRVFDSLDAQVHEGGTWPAYLREDVERIHADVRDRAAVSAALEGVDAVVYLAAAVGVAQSMYQVQRYVEVNSGGIAVLLDLLVTTTHRVRKLVVASSMSLYGEGACHCPRCGPCAVDLRPESQLTRRDWSVRCPRCHTETAPMSTPETQRLRPSSVYAISKRDHEELALAVGRAYGIPTVALRYFNAYGARQSLSNPYNGIAAIIASRLLNGLPPILFEDGRQTRDFIHVSDIARANRLALETSGADGLTVNVGSGRGLSLLHVAAVLSNAIGVHAPPEVTEQYRPGDVRHCYADLTLAQERLGFAPQVQPEDGLAELAHWLRGQPAIDRVTRARDELRARGLLR